MKIKVLAILLCAIALFTCCTPIVIAAEEQGEFELTLDVNKRYTDISEEASGENLFLYGEKEEAEKNTKRNTYIAVLAVALVIAVVVLVLTLKRVPKEDDIDVSGQGKVSKKE